VSAAVPACFAAAFAARRTGVILARRAAWLPMAGLPGSGMARAALTCSRLGRWGIARSRVARLGAAQCSTGFGRLPFGCRGAVAGRNKTIRRAPDQVFAPQAH